MLAGNQAGQDRATDGELSLLARWFAAAFGGFLGLTLLKFGNPPIMEKWVTAPNDIYEFVFGNPWPITWGYVLLGLLTVLGVGVADRKPSAPRWLILLPLAWLAWECLSCRGSISPELSNPTLAHFFACTVCFYLGLMSLGRPGLLRYVLPGVLLGLVFVIVVGWQQHFGGLEQTRRYFFLYLYPRLKEVPPDYLKKLSSTRIFSTLFYPNALAGAMLLLLPVLLEFLWQARKRFTPGARLFLMAALALGALACLYWSGSKGGWLLMLVLSLIWLLRLPFNPNLKRGLVVLVLLVGLTGFFWRYSKFFEKGATSVSARFDYWQAALHTTLAHPLLGTGPGTFALAYAKVKRPESEMSRLVHNDYLEQASDSGVAGCLFYAAFIIGAILLSRSKGLGYGPPPGTGPEGAIGVAAESQKKPPLKASSAEPDRSVEALHFGLWLGVLGWALQGLLEFGLYIPALAWPAFAFLGLLLGRSKRVR